MSKIHSMGLSMKAHFEQFAAYNRWANARLYEAAFALDDADYRRDVRGRAIQRSRISLTKSWDFSASASSECWSASSPSRSIATRKARSGWVFFTPNK